MPVDLTGSIPTIYHDVFEMFNSNGLNTLTFNIFVPLFESNTLTKSILNQASFLNLFDEQHLLTGLYWFCQGLVCCNQDK